MGQNDEPIPETIYRVAYERWGFNPDTQKHYWYQSRRDASIDILHQIALEQIKSDARHGLARNIKVQVIQQTVVSEMKVNEDAQEP